ncbi:lipoprotein signal peptidase [Saccharicrinis fermentans]|uniref:Lipoprotein signal peptidase n=1 Tax=Saccharicrinis fermentans DSM 9555 = JCM 21142 TaxID=869213 RepID=W7Y235_9BACT|nr:lipoprotein signal peptidase [Saccharicrinis fermentans]GAF02022.1 lipoprotein signal peptidase [Saccharicrinis fermentans DSM 9555 = JCM 21142]
MLSILKKPVVIVFLVLLVDQALKIWVKTHMMLGEEFSVFGDWFIIHFIENNGMAFGMELAGKFGKVILSVFRIVAVIGIGYYLYQLTLKKAPTGLIISISLVLAGAVGNIIDSAFYGLIFNDSYPQVASLFPAEGGYSTFLHGKVVDMFYFPLWEGNFPQWLPFWGGEHFLFFRPVFNVADSAITIGIAIILLFQRKYFK